jgi:proline iminopeptidase
MIESTGTRMAGTATGSERPALQKGLAFLWLPRHLALAVVIGVVASFALLSAWLTPRGPITAAEALVTMAAALLVGIVSGVMMGNRWSVLVAPVLYLALFELARLGVEGPTVDGIYLGSLYGWIAFGVGRLFHGLLVLAPMALGALYGVSLARRLGNPRVRPLGRAGWLFTGLLTLALLALALLIARPATTAPVPGLGGQPLAGSIAELTRVSIGGQEQALMIRGRSTGNPVLLYMAGGPGGTDLGALRQDTGLEQHFVVVSWEQRGVGKSYSALDPVETLTLAQAVEDTIELTNYLRERFAEEKIYLVGQSWGSTLGVMAAQQRPELYHAFVGVGQMVSQRVTDIMHYEDTLAWAEQTGNTALVAALQRSGPPPYTSILDYEPALAHEHDWNPYPELDLGNEMPGILFVPENTLMDRVNGFRSFLDTFAVLYPQLQGVDFRKDVPRLEVPVYMILGEHETRGRALPAREWFAMLDAPSKEWTVFEGSGHRAHFDRPADFAALMRRVEEETYPASNP